MDLDTLTRATTSALNHDSGSKSAFLLRLMPLWGNFSSLHEFCPILAGAHISFLVALVCDRRYL